MVCVYIRLPQSEEGVLSCETCCEGRGGVGQDVGLFSPAREMRPAGHPRAASLFLEAVHQRLWNAPLLHRNTALENLCQS